MVIGDGKPIAEGVPYERVIARMASVPSGPRACKPPGAFVGANSRAREFLDGELRELATIFLLGKGMLANAATDAAGMMPTTRSGFIDQCPAKVLQEFFSHASILCPTKTGGEVATAIESGRITREVGTAKFQREHANGVNEPLVQCFGISPTLPDPGGIGSKTSDSTLDVQLGERLS